MPVSPESVWEVLAHAESFGYWVVGSKLIRDAEPDWPAPGSKFHHTVGVGPFKVSDHTEAVASRPPWFLELRAKTRPLGTAKVELELSPQDGGTLVRMSESPEGLYSALALNPFVHLFTLGRNAEALMRLEELALRQAAK
jgi:uncharacterized protein YndB with AHSA1/START domain